jgi:hypothetical protein
MCAFGNLIKAAAAADEKMMIARLGGRERRPLFSPAIWPRNCGKSSSSRERLSTCAHHAAAALFVYSTRGERARLWLVMETCWNSQFMLMLLSLAQPHQFSEFSAPRFPRNLAGCVHNFQRRLGKHNFLVCQSDAELQNEMFFSGKK